MVCSIHISLPRPTCEERGRGQGIASRSSFDDQAPLSCSGSCFLTGLGLLPGADDDELHRFEFKQVQMGTAFRIVLYAADEATAKKAADAAFARIAELDGIMSDYKSTSELMELCKKAGGDRCRSLGDDLLDVLTRGVENFPAY